MIQTHEFHDMGELEDTSNALARASERPLVVDHGQTFSEAQDAIDRGVQDPMIAEDRKIIWNERDNRLAYIGSADYELIQHREVVDNIRGAVAQTAGSIDFGMIRDYGSRIDGVIVFGNQDQAHIDLQDLLGDSYIPPEQQPDTDEYAEESAVRDAVGLGMRFRNSFDGGRKVGGSTMGYRYVCQNWMVHDEETIGRVDQVHLHELTEEFFADIILDVFEMKEQTESIIVESEETEFPLSWAPSILVDVGFGRNYRSNILDELATYNHVDDETTTLWRLYNAATNYLDNERVNEMSDGRYNTMQQRAWKILTLDEIEEPDVVDEEYAEAIA